MPLYDYQCQQCGNEFEEVMPISGRETAPCPNCASIAKQVIKSSKPHIFQPFWHENFDVNPVYVESKKHWRQLCEKYNVYAPHEFGTSRNLKEI